MGPYLVRDTLKNLKFRWDPLEKCWHRSVPAEGFNFNSVLSQRWLRADVKVKVYSETREVGT